MVIYCSTKPESEDCLRQKNVGESEGGAMTSLKEEAILSGELLNRSPTKTSCLTGSCFEHRHMGNASCLKGFAA